MQPRCYHGQQLNIKLEKTRPSMEQPETEVSNASSQNQENLDKSPSILLPNTSCSKSLWNEF